MLNQPFDSCWCAQTASTIWVVFGAVSFFVDQCLAMGSLMSCAYFECFSSFVEYVAKEETGLQ